MLRNPLDMVLSYAKHFGQTHEQAATAICNKKNALVGDQVFTGSFISRWADHVESWTSHKPYPVLTLRYEDMMNDPVTAFGKALDHLGLPVESERLSRAIRHSSFEELRKQEQDQGFIESSSVSDVGFFRQGKAGHWRDELDLELAGMIRKANSRAMKRFRYYET